MVVLPEIFEKIKIIQMAFLKNIWHDILGHDQFWKPHVYPDKHKIYMQQLKG